MQVHSEVLHASPNFSESSPPVDHNSIKLTWW